MVKHWLWRSKRTWPSRVTRIKQQAHGIAPMLATILVGDDPISATYVRMKGNACQRIGMVSRPILLPAATTTEELLAEIDRLNADPEAVHGILLQHPVPAQIDERCCFDRISLAKDVDGVTVLGFGTMAMALPAFGAATPAGIMRCSPTTAFPWPENTPSWSAAARFWASRWR